MPNGKIIDLKTYESVKENLSKNGNIEEIIIKTETRNDSIIKSPKLTVLTTIDKSGNYSDPYSKFKKNIGKHFPIENFKSIDKKSFKTDELNGKPTFVNFWFTNCTPCVEEIPVLNKLKEEFGDKINFVAITFDTKEKVEEFLKKRKINFRHIVNSKQQLKNMEIQAYPMNYILDKDGNIVNVYGEISLDENEIYKILKKLL
jgi:cytochrome c biogenesis protein CcmG/thiol:disulfide interchange protein DsbE